MFRDSEKDLQKRKKGFGELKKKGGAFLEVLLKRGMRAQYCRAADITQKGALAADADQPTRSASGVNCCDASLVGLKGPQWLRGEEVSPLPASFSRAEKIVFAGRGSRSLSVCWGAKVVVYNFATKKRKKIPNGT